MFDIWAFIVDALDSLMLLLWPKPAYRSLRPPKRKDDVKDGRMEEFAKDMKRQFEGHLSVANLLAMSGRLQEQFKLKLESSNICMLPSYIHTLPSGKEKGTYLALDVGGSTLRVAAVQLFGRKNGHGGSCMEILKMNSYRIDNFVKSLKGHAFFDWMAERIAEVLEDPIVKPAHGATKVAMGLAWSFPIEQTSARTAKLLIMGKGFSASEGVTGEDLGSLLMLACEKKSLNVQLDAIINDGQATLMTRAYQDDALCFGLILGTGTNMAINLPTKAFARSKFGVRPQTWFDEAVNVVVNTELSMFGKDVWPMTRWDTQLNKNHERPDFQPLEHMIGGRYMGELVRLVLVEAIQTTGLFGGHFPQGFLEPYTVETSTTAAFEDDETPELSKAAAVLEKNHPMKVMPMLAELRFVQEVVRAISHRAAAYLATGIHSLWSLRLFAEGLTPADAGHVTIGCNGSIIERYPRFRSVAQAYLDDLIKSSGGTPGTVVLEVAYESAIFGAAVAASCLEGQP
ncbi:hypothetical protein, variant [Verruconis gallopava]|uniref:Phosphotransferase n=1 Tax=Verruconis gallopava TaxID=253628 RepID=A0A0D1Z531_9PEZI|nr:uncharacterized protein PV09_01000 [Verruconis gallopava]XP_016217927.1 hypothetical protein, variant [Verruconis gallopava]KIW08057.1 hypothetical protein PV09_01000 [Verruconis gallopava]KIW08058.1 hypothetical protein, variant [Verruconis gallopava]